MFKSNHVVSKGIKEGFIISGILSNRSDVNTGHVFLNICLDVYTLIYIYT